MDRELVETIFKWLKARLRVKSDRQLAKQLGLPPETVAAWKRRGSISAKGLLHMYGIVGRSLGSVLGLDDETDITQRAKASLARLSWATAELAAQIQRLQRNVEDLPPSALDVTEQIVAHFQSAPREDFDAVVWLLAGLRASKEIRDHLIGQLNLIARLVIQQELEVLKHARGQSTMDAKD